MIKKLLSVILILSFTLTFFTACQNENVEVTKTEYYQSYGLWKTFSSFSKAKKYSDIVVYGEISEIQKSYFSVPDGGIARTPVIITPIKILKGDNSTEKIIYHALGGIMGDTEYISDVYPTSNFEVGSKVLLFLEKSDNGDFYVDISPSFTFLEDSEGKISVEKRLIPKEWRVSDDLIPYIRVSFWVDTDNVIELIEIGFTKWKEKYRNE
ncbi:MAG: hypothetical protein J6M16_10860 [Clostridia bacterium]|nr:hypothetical protein [Clostridia bacterium]